MQIRKPRQPSTRGKLHDEHVIKYDQSGNHLSFRCIYKSCGCNEKRKTIDRAVGIRSFMDLSRVCESQSAAVGASVADHITTP